MNASTRYRQVYLPHLRDALHLACRTINAPLPVEIKPSRLLFILRRGKPGRTWQAHVESFFDEVPPDIIGLLVVAGGPSYIDLESTSRRWMIQDGRSLPWVREMAELERQWLASESAAYPA